VTFDVIDPVAPAGIRVHPAPLCRSTPVNVKSPAMFRESRALLRS
jgi:hypothetical protein